MTLQTVARVPSELLKRILELAGIDMILVGGQALAFWAAYYHTPTPTIAVTKDVDLLGTKADVERLARGLGAKAVFPHKIAKTILVGQVLKSLPGGDYVNIDVMFRVYGNIATEAIADRAVLAENPAGRFRVMHPIDVLQGRLERLALSDAGRKVAKRYGVHVADAIDPGPVVHIESFMSRKLPQLLNLMSAARRTELRGY